MVGLSVVRSVVFVQNVVVDRTVVPLCSRTNQEIGEGKIIHYNHRRGLTLDDNPR